MDKPGTYRIEVQGQLDASWSDRLGGMQITTDCSGKLGTVTTLEGRLRDEAALIGVLNSLYELHLRILSVNCDTSDETTAAR
jgi:hypothetical protein